MAEQRLKVRPTKIELIRLKRRLALSQRVERIVKDRLSILTMEFLQVARECAELRERLLEEFRQAYKALTITGGYHGRTPLERELVVTEGGVELQAGARNVAGVRMPLFELGEAKAPGARGYGLQDTSAWLDQSANSAAKVLETLVELAEAERGLELLGMQIRRAKRIRNALEYVVIPSLQVTIKYLYMKFEEREREEKGRLKRVKVILERQQ
jgi:V/A-type H+-transporting ATPase subunit D